MYACDAHSAYGFDFWDKGMQNHWFSWSEKGLLLSVLDLVQCWEWLVV
jgi:hypothetical protein